MLPEIEHTPTPDPRRPLSPHLQIYRWQLTMSMSILHRITGAALCFGTLLIATILIAAALSPSQYQTVSHYVKSPLGLFCLFGWSFCLYYHLFNGIRHLIWDTGHLLKIENAYRAGYVVLLLTALATACTWLCAMGNT